MSNSKNIAVRLSDFASQENCDGEPYDTMQAASDYIRELEARLAAAEADAEDDAERLDWLDRMNSALNSHYGTNYRWKLIMSPNVVRLYAGRGESGYVGALDLCDSNSGRGAKSSVREAIDKARGERNG